MIYAYIFVMAGVTYLIRMLPLTLIQKKITNVYFRSFLYYIPYACLTAMTFPAILYATQSPVSGMVGLVIAVLSCPQEEKPDRCGRVCLRGSIFGRTHIRNITDMLRKYEGD